MNIETAWKEITVDDQTRMRVYTARPKENGRRPGLMVFQEAFGVNSYIRSVADRFAQEGFASWAPELFHRTAPGIEIAYTDFEKTRPQMEALSITGLEADLRACHAAMSQDTGIIDGEIASIGFCLGGRVSYLASLTLTMKAAISFYGARIGPDLVERAASAHVPLLFFWGAQDTHIPRDGVNHLLDALKAHGKTYVNIEMSDAGHGFFCDQRPSYHAPSAQLAWPMCLEFLKMYLKMPATL